MGHHLRLLPAAILLLGCVCDLGHSLNLAPFFTADMNQQTITENTPVGTVIFQLKGEDPEGSAVHFGLQGTDKLAVDRSTGVVTVAEAIDREGSGSDSEIRLVVTIEDGVGNDSSANVVRVPISVIVLDENDNEPVFTGLPYKGSVDEDTPVGTTIFRAIEATDKDLVGEVLDVKCVSEERFCRFFEIVPRRQETDHDMYRGSVVLKKSLDYREQQIHQIVIAVWDGRHNVTTEVIFAVNDIQNSPPVFMGSMTGVVSEDDPVGTLVMQVKAKDGDSGDERSVVYDLAENPGGYFVIDANSGEVRVERTLDRESVSASSGVLRLKVKAAELVNGIPGEDATTASFADVTITIRDVNDEAPTFNQQEYNVSIPENVPFGTPLANLNMEIKDTDTGPNAVFNIALIDETGKFSVEPSRANSHTAVSIKVNSQKLDYENPNERKFLLLVVASEEGARANGVGLSSTATVTVQVQDLNDNSPTFDKESFTALVSEGAPEGTEVITIAAKDRDSGDFGTNGIRYKLSGTGAELFNVDPITGRIVVAPCSVPSACLDFETTKAYFLSYSATDNNGEGKRTVVNLRVSVDDANDNPPSFAKKQYAASINEGQRQFQPRLFLKASDSDESSALRYELVDGNVNGLFALDPATGEITVAAAPASSPKDKTGGEGATKDGLRLDNIPTDVIRLNAVVTDGIAKDSATVDISVKDVNDRKPEFEKKVYLSSIPENAPVGTAVENVKAADADFGANAEVTYRIQKGAYNDFAVDATSGLITTSSELDYDRRDSYSIELVAVDGGVPSLSGTATLTVSVMKKNSKEPFFSPSTQRAQVTEDAPVGTLVMQLVAMDPDVTESGILVYSIVEPITAVDHDGKPVSDLALQPALSQFFALNATTGQIFVAGHLDRDVATVITLPVRVTDTSASESTPQFADGSAVISLVDVNDFEPTFREPWTKESPYITINVAEEQQNGSVVHRFLADDPDSNIDYFKIHPKNKYFDVEPGSGHLFVKGRIDYEELAEKRITFDLHVYDTGVPQKSASALVVANVENLNDNEPVFAKSQYEASLPENADTGTPVVQVNATDLDEGEFGIVRFRLSGTNHEAFAIDAVEGTITVVDPSVLDRERVDSIVLQVVAVDSSPIATRSSTVPVNITIVDVNDNPPQFQQKDYAVTIVDNIPFYPESSPIVQVLAVDPDIGKNAKLHYAIVAGNDEGRFHIDSDLGIIYPNISLLGQSGQRFELTVEVSDEGGNVSWPNPDQARVVVDVENVNSHKPEWFPEPPPGQTIEIPEESEETDVVILKVNARDKDVGDNQRISYFIKDRNENVHETEKFSINEVTGELKAKGRFDRETQERYELVLVARDHGTPVAFETLRFVTVLIKDINDNGPRFPNNVFGDMIRFTVPEEEEPGYFVGRIEANDPDEGKNGRVYYYIIEGNEGRWFSIDKSYGNIYTKRRIDRESVDQFNLTIKASNEADFICEGETCDLKMTSQDVAEQSVVKVQIFVEDKNDNLPQFRNKEFFIGIPFSAKIGDLILNAEAHDPDLGGNGKLTYAIKSSNLFRAGSTVSSGSLVPSPFTMQENGRLVLASLMAEFNQDKFEIDIEAKESESNHRAKARVHIWIYEPSQLIKLVIQRSPREVHEDKDQIVAELRNVTQRIIAIDDIRFHVSQSEGLQRDVTDMYVHAVDGGTNVISPPEEVLKEVDKNHDHLALYYKEAGISSIVPAVRTESSSLKTLDSNLIALIVILIIIFIGVVMFTILCCCMKGWVATAEKEKMPLPPHLQQQKLLRDVSPIYNTASILDEAAAVSPILSPTPAGGTDNPLWIDQKYKVYEEQELTMTVFSDQDNSVISGGNNGQDQSLSSQNDSMGIGGGGGGGHQAQQQQQQMQHMDSQSNAYATINKLPMIPASRRSLFGVDHFGGGGGGVGHYERDYATLEKPARSPPGPLVPGIHSTPNQFGGGAMLSRRFSNDFSPDVRSNFVINKNGEPELTADLM